jgi:hypothetical protein
MIAARTVQVPEDLCAAAEKKFGTTFANVEELLVFVLRDLLRDEGAKCDEAEQRFVEGRLRELGYL